MILLFYAAGWLITIAVLYSIIKNATRGDTIEMYSKMQAELLAAIARKVGVDDDLVTKITHPELNDPLIKKELSNSKK